MADVQLPALGESVTEGIITSWLVEVGDEVEVDQPLVEISTDKVDTEIPSPVAGTVEALHGEVDDTIDVGTVIAVIGDGTGGGGDSAPSTPSAGPAPEASSAPAPAPAPAAPSGSGSGRSDVSAGAGVLASPLVRRLLREAGLSAADVAPSGSGGRITREDAERAIAAGGEGSTAPADGQAPAPATTQAPAPTGGGITPPPTVVAAPAAGVPARPTAGTTQIDFAGDREVTQDLSRVRKAIASGMKQSLDTTAQLTAIVEVDMTSIMNLRAAVKDEFKAREGVSLSPLPFICRAVTMTLARHPGMNSSVDVGGGTQTFHRFVNLGIAVDTERGLLVPNIKDAQDLTVTGIANRIGDLARRTRGKGLKPDEISGGTFTVTNTGSLGTLMDTPILNPPEVGILGAAAIEKRPVVVSDGYGDSIAIRWMTYLCLSYDHQALDGADSARFLQDLKWVLEHHDFRSELGL
jgi:2-oxoglutarate dehydrogenase E2 component (dihydrolipoamide succinyltransferase)